MENPLVVVGTLQVPATMSTLDNAKGHSNMVRIGMRDVQFVKGVPPTTFSSFVWYTDYPEYGGISGAALAKLDGKRVIAFVAYGADSDAIPGDYYLSYGHDDLMAFDAALLEKIQSEIRRQAALKLAVDAYMAAHHLPHQFYVSYLTNLLKHSWSASLANSWIVHLDCSYVPALAQRMDDRSPVAFGHVRFFDIPNRFPGAWEAVRHYGPKTVADILDAVLNDITGAPGGEIMNGAGEYQRQQAVTFWRTYVGLYFSNQDTQPLDHFAITGPSPQACKGLQ